MFKFTQQQIQTLDEIAQNKFRMRLSRFLQEELPKESSKYSPQEFARLIEACQQRASSSYGIQTEQGIAQFLCLAVAIDPNFDMAPEIQAFLTAPGSNPEEQLDRIIDSLDHLTRA